VSVEELAFGADPLEVFKTLILGWLHRPAVCPISFGSPEIAAA